MPVLITPEPNTSRAGGVYIPPFKLARMQRDANDKSSPEYQRQTWEALRKSLNGIINKVNVVNIGNIIPEIFQENLVRGRGLFCRAIMKAQLTSPGFTHVYAALIAVINTKLPEVGELLLKRVVFQFRRAYKRNDKVLQFLFYLVLFYFALLCFALFCFISSWWQSHSLVLSLTWSTSK